MRLKDFLPLILKNGNYPYIRILQQRKTCYEVAFHGKAQDVPYRLLDKEIEVIRACCGEFEVHLVSEEKCLA